MSFDDATPATLRRLRSSPGRIAVTLNGIVGDCGWDNPELLLFQRPLGTGRARTREMVQVVPKTTLTDRSDPMFGWCLGLDNRELLPPFTPIGRAEDVGFGALLSSCFPDHYVLHLPWTLLHAPPEPKTFSEEAPFAVGFNGWLPSVLTGFEPPFGTSATRLAQMGEYAQQLGRLRPTAFDDFVYAHLLESLAARIAELEAHLHEAPSSWKKDARAEIARMRAGALVPVSALYCLPGGRDAVQRQLRRYGAMLRDWPALMDAARDLRSRGKRLAQAVA